MSDLAQSLFDEGDSTPIALEQVVFDYRLLSEDKREFVLQKTDETQILLKRTAENIIQIGKNLQSVSDALPQGMFLPWLKSEFGMSQPIAYNFMQVAKRFDGKIINFINLPVSALYLLAAPKTSQEAVDEALERSQKEKITQALAKQIIEEQEARKKAEQSEVQARADQEVIQHLLLKTEEEASSKIEDLQNQIAVLQQKMAELTTPPVEYVEKPVWPEDKVAELADLQKGIDALNATLEAEKRNIPPDAQKKIDTLQTLLDKLREERKQQEELSKQQEARIKKLNDDINTAIRNREFVENADRIRQGWRTINSEVHSCLMRLLGQWPTPVDVQTFDADDWARVDHLKATLQRVLDECNSLRYSSNDMVIEANGHPYALSAYDVES